MAVNKIIIKSRCAPRSGSFTTLTGVRTGSWIIEGLPKYLKESDDLLKKLKALVIDRFKNEKKMKKSPLPGYNTMDCWEMGCFTQDWNHGDVPSQVELVRHKTVC